MRINLKPKKKYFLNLLILLQPYYQKIHDSSCRLVQQWVLWDQKWLQATSWKKIQNEKQKIELAVKGPAGRPHHIFNWSTSSMHVLQSFRLWLFLHHFGSDQVQIEAVNMPLKKQSFYYNKITVCAPKNGQPWSCKKMCPGIFFRAKEFFPQEHLFKHMFSCDTKIDV